MIGILLDSSRNFMPIDVIENVINGMAFNKVISDLLPLIGLPQTFGKIESVNKAFLF